MSSKDLINLGVAPDSGTGDSARRGGEKINFLFADIYATYGDNPVGADPGGMYYGYRQPYLEHQYKVGELHATGKFSTVRFQSKDSDALRTVLPKDTTTAQSTTGFGVDSDGDWVISDPDATTVPDIYRDSEWYFLSRGEQVTLDLTNVSDSEGNNQVHIVLPLAKAGDMVRIRDSFGTWGGKVINVWTTPYDFQSVAQVNEWLTWTNGVTTDSDITSALVSVREPDGEIRVPMYRKPKLGAGVATAFTGLNINWSPSVISTPVGDAGDYDYAYYSTLQISSQRNVEYEYIYQGPTSGWIFKRRALASVADSIEIMQDFFTDEDWIQWDSDDLTVTDASNADEIEITKDSYILLVAPNTTVDYSEFVAGSTPVVKVHRRMSSNDDVVANDGAITTSTAHEQIKSFLRSRSYTTSGLTEAQYNRISVVGGYTNGELNNYSGFSGSSANNIYKEVTVSKIADDQGNIMLISAEPFTGFVQLIVPQGQ